MERSRAADDATPRERILGQLNQAIALFQRVRDIASTEIADIDLYLPRCLSNLGAAFVLRYGLTGEPGDLDQAINSARTAIDVIPGEDGPQRAMYLSNLSIMLMRRYDAFGMLDDIDAAIEQQRIATAMTEDSDPHRSGRAGLLVSLLTDRFADTQDTRDIAEAISVGEQLVRSASDDPHLPANAANLAGCYVTRYHHEQQAQQEARLSDLDRAIELGEWAVRRQAGAASLRHVLSNLSEALHQRFCRTRLEADITRAVDYAGRAVAQTEPGDPARAAHLINLGAAWCDYTRFGDGGAGAMRSAVAALTEAMAMTSAPARTRLSAARLCGECAGLTADWDNAIAAYWTAVRLLPRIARRGVDRETRERLLADTDGLAGVAAAQAIKAGRPEAAVELLEFGRGVLWSQLLETDVDRQGGGQAARPGERGDDGGPALGVGVDHGGHGPGDHPGGPAGEGQEDGLGQKLGADVAAGGAQRAAQPDLRAPFQDGDDHDVGDADGGDQQRDRAQAQEQAVERPGGVGLGGQRGRGLGGDGLAGVLGAGLEGEEVVDGDYTAGLGAQVDLGGMAVEAR